MRIQASTLAALVLLMSMGATQNWPGTMRWVRTTSAPARIVLQTAELPPLSVVEPSLSTPLLAPLTVQAKEALGSTEAVDPEKLPARSTTPPWKGLGALTVLLVK